MWTDLLDFPQKVTSYYPEGPSLHRFALMEIHLHGGSVKLIGDLASLPDPLPTRWRASGYSRAQCTIHALSVSDCSINGAPRVGFDADNCMEGKPVDIEVTADEQTWSADGGIERPLIRVAGSSDILTFTFTCRNLTIEIRGYEPAPY